MKNKLSLALLMIHLISFSTEGFALPSLKELANIFKSNQQSNQKYSSITDEKWNTPPPQINLSNTELESAALRSLEAIAELKAVRAKAKELGVSVSLIGRRPQAWATM
jgi:hypothetical protein